MRSCPPPGPIHPVSSVRSPTQGSRRRRQLNACNVFRRLPSYCFPLIYDLVREMRAESLASGISPFEEVPGSFNKKPALCFNILKDDLSIVASHCLQPGRFGLVRLGCGGVINQRSSGTPLVDFWYFTFCSIRYLGISELSIPLLDHNLGGRPSF